MAVGEELSRERIPCRQERASWVYIGPFQGDAAGIWYNLSDFKLAAALDDRISWRRFCAAHCQNFRQSAQHSYVSEKTL
ncbi:transposase [Labrenzia sp. THAF82]|uniref:transposase n=1 Tax=Labrenzia sp. THAF82 TaxID=2587861 RepID=UPI0012686FD8